MTVSHDRCAELLTLHHRCLTEGLRSDLAALCAHEMTKTGDALPTEQDFVEDLIDILRDRIALYRSYLARGVSEALTLVYINDLAVAEAELAGLEGRREAAASDGRNKGGRASGDLGVGRLGFSP